MAKRKLFEGVVSQWYFFRRSLYSESRPTRSGARHHGPERRTAEAMAAQVQWLPTERPAIGVAVPDRK